MKLVVADTNAFLRFLLNDISEQVKKFEKILKQAQKSEIIIVVPQIIIFELNFILSKYYLFPKQDVVEKLQSIIKTPYFKIQDIEIFREAIKLYAKSNLSLADSFVYYYCEAWKADLFTFDKKLSNLK
ncbi:MAG: PIN domain-containing protein [Candidatus Daviesbacteria bacterium]|nr:PIN domain-containing protein [Candidatus Daviesbacteria bacterium]